MFVTFNKPQTDPFDLALEAHRTGRLQEAEGHYRQALAQNPNHTEAMHMLGLLAHQVGQSAAGVELMERSMAVQVTAPLCSNLAEVKRALGQVAEAEALCRRAIEMQPTLAAAHTNLAMALQQQGRFQEALDAALKAVQFGPNEVAGHNAAGVALLDLGRPMEAAKYIDAALRLNPNDPMIWTAAGFCCERLEQPEKAVEHLQRAVALAPEHPRVLLHMGGMLARLEKFAESEGYLERAFQKEPGLSATLEQLAGVKMSLRKFEESIALCRKYIELYPQSPDIYATMGEALMGLGRFEECITEMSAALKKFNNFAILQTLSNAHVRDGRPEVGLEVLETALAVAPENPILHFNKSIILMLMGKYELAWPEYEWRWQHPRMGWRNRQFGKPKWDGSPLNGKRILLHAEQGMGDTIFFGRYITRVAERGGVPVVFAQTSMVELVKTIKGTAEVIGEGVQLPQFDVHMPLMSLPGVFGTTVDANIPSDFPYIQSNPEKKAYWTQEFAKRAGNKLKVGLVWEGGPFQPENFLRSASLAAYAPLADVKDVAFFGLQKGAAEFQSKTPPAGMDFTDLAPFIKDFSDTAAMLDSLDLLISIDTSVVHVAAALGKPVWMMLAYSPGHMWMLHRNDSPWYPTMRIWRQPAFKDWATPVAQVKAELEKFVAERRR